jgi:hypothetical protein
MKVWVTQYALSKGIAPVEHAELSEGGTMVSWLSPGGWRMFAHGNAWHRTEADAITDAERRRATKIASLKKQIAKLEKLSFQPMSSAEQRD